MVGGEKFGCDIVFLPKGDGDIKGQKGGVSLSLHPSTYCRGGECRLYARPPMGTGQGGAHPGGEVTREPDYLG